MEKRIISIILVFAILIGVLPGTSLAAIEELKGNTSDENKAILEQLSQLTGGSSDEAYALLESLGLLDENGDLNLSQSIVIDGVSMTIDEVMALLEDPATDLSRIADVDGTPIALGDLKTMIQIEKELARIRDTYFSGKTFNQEQLNQLENLLNQIRTEGISAMFMGAQSSDLKLVITPDPNNPTGLFHNQMWKHTLKYKITLEGTLPENGTVSFSWKRVSGFLPDDYFEARFSYHTKYYYLMNSIDGRITVGPGADIEHYIIDDPEQFEGELIVTINPNNSNLYDILGCNISGMLKCFIEFYDPDGLTFSYNNQESDLVTIPFDIAKDYAFEHPEGALTWLTSMDGVSNYERPMTLFPNDIGEFKNGGPQWTLIDDDYRRRINFEAFSSTAKEIYGTEENTIAYYKVEAYLALLFPDNAYDEGAYLVKGIPVGYDNSSTPQLLEPIEYYWGGDPDNVFEVNLAARPIELKDRTSYPTIPYFYASQNHEYNYGGLYVSMVLQSTNGKPPYMLDASWPQVPYLSDDYTSYGSCNTGLDVDPGYQVTYSSILSIYDNTPPVIESITVPAGTYTAGQYVPIVITFSEPVNTSEIIMKINGNDVTASELLMNYTGRKAMAMYKVPKIDATTISISNVSDFEDLLGNTATSNNGGAGWNFSDVTLVSTLMKDAVTAVSVSPDYLPARDIQNGVTVTLGLDQEEAYRTKYAAYDPVSNKAPFSLKLTKSSSGEVRAVDTYLTESEATLSATADIDGFDYSGTDEVYLVEVIAYESPSDTTGTIIKGVNATFTVQGIGFVNGVSISYPPDDKTELSLTDTYRPKLGVTFAGNPTFTTGTWASSNPDIATIDASGQVILTGNAVGKVKFTFTADDGGLTDPDPSHIKSATSKEYTVIAGASLALVIPGATNRIEARQNHLVEVRWSSNSNFFSTNDFEYTIELFTGYYTEGQLSGKTPVYTVTAPNTVNRISIPGEKISVLSINRVPAYTVRISMPHPAIETEILSALCYIIVSPAPSAVHLVRPTAGLYLTDSETAVIGWAIENFAEGITETEFRIEKTSTVNGKDVVSQVHRQSINQETGQYTLVPDVVNGLKDTYMIIMRAKNPQDEGYSSDSFPLYVYNSDALKLEVNGQKVTSLTMDNGAKVSGTLPTDTSSILALREELALIEYIGINYNDYSWSQLKDGIKWYTSDPQTVSINYRQGGLYEDLSRFSMEIYLPEAKMALSSVKDGTATITATHANTGMSDSVTVDVRTLREKFYLFQLTPMQRTELSYTDGKGNAKTVYTNNEGVLALYEPNGIASDIFLRAEGGDGSVWLGTIYLVNLLSGERDATRMQLYPLNTLKLRQAAKTEIFLKKPDGSPYTGSIILRGGVYKNGGYCQSAGILGNMIPSPDNPLKDGKTGQTVVIGSDGKLTVYMDSIQFWSEEKGENSASGTDLKARDNLQYIFEITGMNGYYPVLIEANGNLTPSDIIRSAESVVILDTHTGDQRPFISNQTVDYGLTGGRLIDVRKSKCHIGPNDIYPEVKLLTTILLWGQDPQNKYNMEICDEYGYVPKNQISKMVTYPFSTIPVLRNTLILSHNTITKTGWVPAGKDMGIKTRLYRGNVMMLELPISPRVLDLSQVPKLREADNIAGLLVELESSSGVSPSPEMSNGNKIINGLLQFLGKINGPVDGTSFKMIITPTEDNTIFKALIWAGYDSLGLDDIDYGEEGVTFDHKYLEASISTAPSLNDLADMAKGSYDPNQAFNEARENQKQGKANSSTDFNGQLEGYFEAQIQYNFEKGKWEIYVLGGGFTTGLGIDYKYTVNAQAGPVPVTATFGVGGSVQLDFKAAVRYSEQSGLAWSYTVTGDRVNDYLTTLRINAYLSAFGGVGWDYSVVALKIGLFGKITIDNQNKWLSRTYLVDSSLWDISGQALQLSGEVGVKFVAQLLTISIEFVLGSGSVNFNYTFNDWNTIVDYWENTGSGIKRSASSSQSPINGLRPVSVSATLQSREYLEKFARSWGNPQKRMSLMGMDPSNALEQLQSNAYPYSLPQVSDDGQLLLYAFDNNSIDVKDTRIFATKLSSGSYPPGTVIPAPAGFEGFGDSSLSLAGTESFAIATWVRQSASLPGKTAGQTLSSAEQALLMNGAEIVAAVYDGADWTASRLTDNSTPDLAPIAATNGSTAIVAWRSVYAGDSENLLDFTQQDHILCSIYSGGAWSTPIQIYNGTSGVVRGIDAAMLSDGTAAVAYTLDTDSTDGSSTDYEIGYAIVDNTGAHSFSGIITQDEWMDENPQITAVEFEPVDDRFVLGWHSIRDGVSDIRLAAVDKNGALSNSFIESIAQAAGNSSVNVGGDFHFAGMTDDRRSISNLSVLWPESKTNSSGETDHSVLKAVKFNKEGNSINISAALEVIELPSRTIMDHFDSYVESDDGKTVKAVVQGTTYSVIDPSDPDTYTVYTDADGNNIYIPAEEVKLYTATATYENKVRLDTLMVDYANLNVNTLVPIQFAIFNAGLDTISNIEVDIEGNVSAFVNLNLKPNESRTLTCWHPVGDTVENLDYDITAYFGAETHLINGIVYLDYPDIGISRFEMISEDRGIRTMQLTLYNSSVATLSGGKNRSVKIGFYDDALLESIQTVSTNTPEVIVNADKTLEISDEDSLMMIDEGAFTIEVSFDIGEYMTDSNGQKQEIPESGVRLYAKAWAEETGSMSGQTRTSVIPEYSKNDNTASILFESRIHRSGRLVSLTVEQGISANNNTAANIQLRNNSLLGRTTGNLVVTLLDNKGNILEQQQTYNGSSGSLINLEGEETKSCSFAFNESGSRVTAVYGDMVLSSNNARLSALSFEGLPVLLSDFELNSEGQYVFNVSNTELTSTLISFMTEDPGATVTINGKPVTGSKNVGIPAGSSEIVIVVTAADGEANQSYILSLNRNAAPPAPSDKKSDSEIAVNIKEGSAIIGTIPYVLSQNNFKAMLDADKANAIFQSKTGVIIEIPAIQGVDTYALELPADILAEAQDGVPPTFATPFGSIQIPGGMLSDQSGLSGKKAAISLGKGDKSALTDEEKAAIGDRPLIQLALIIDGIQTEWNNPDAPVKITIPYTPTEEELKNPESIIIWYLDGSGKLLSVPNGQYDSETGTVTFYTAHFSQYAVGYNPISFKDVDENAWYSKAVSFIAARGITAGTGNGNYSPLAKLTRGEYIVLLMRALDIAPDTNPKDNFTDAGNTYYTGYLAAAKRLGISAGIGNNMFGPGLQISRQEIFTLTYNALKQTGKLPETDTGKRLEDYSDKSQISNWAKEAMEYFVKTGIIVGSGNKLYPKEMTTRAEIAQAIKNILSLK